MKHQRTENRGQRTEVLSRLRRVLNMMYRNAVHNNLSSVFCPLSSGLRGAL